MEIESTPGHKYYLPESKQWISAQDLKVGDKALTSDGKYAIIESVKAVHYDIPHTTYNFEVEEFHTYYVGTGICVHNMNTGDCGNIKKTSGLTEEQIKRLKTAAGDMPRGEYSVYLSETDDYVGITKQFSIRKATHKNRNNRIVNEIISNLDGESARIIEQTVINEVGRVVKGTGPLCNIRNSIAATNPLTRKVDLFQW